MNKLEKVAREIGVPVDGDAVSNHTPGPWTVEEYRQVPESMATYMVKYPATSPKFDAKKRRWIQAPCTKQLTHVNAKADAQLIAAAPDLLEACKQLIGCIDNAEPIPTEAYQSIRDALAKAQGK